MDVHLCIADRPIGPVLHLNGQRRRVYIPQGIKQLMEEMSSEVLRCQPSDIYEFLANYLETRIEDFNQKRQSPSGKVEHGKERRHSWEWRTWSSQGSSVLSDEELLLFVSEFNIPIEAAEHLATVIQSMYRGFQARKDFAKLIAERTRRRSSLWEEWINEGNFKFAEADIQDILLYYGHTLREANHAATKIQAMFRGYFARKSIEISEPSIADLLKGLRITHEQADKNATTIQSFFRGHKVRKELKTNAKHSLDETSHEDYNTEGAGKPVMGEITGLRAALSRRTVSIDPEKEAEKEETIQGDSTLAKPNSPGAGNSETTETEVQAPVTKSPLDKREYRGLTLSNGLKVLLINDSDTDISAASLSVNAGSLHDPKDIQGLAHFCEHMLFLGTDVYPEENEYNKFLAEHGGSSNAYTALDHTNYYFDISPKALEPALHRFAQFFICPRFTESASEREVNAVNSEHDKNISSDMWRKHQLESTVSNPSHAYSMFGTGNRETLWNIPRKNNIDVRGALLSYYKKYYSANVMNLAVLGSESLDTLQTMVAPLFSSIANKQIERPKWTENPFGSNEVGHRIDFVPIKDLRSLSVLFPIPDTTEFYKTSAERYLGHLIGHEGPGSLLSLLKKNNWVNSLSAGAECPAHGFALFKINVDLSPDGLKHTEDIIYHIFQYLEMLKTNGVQKWIWEELRDINAVQFRYKDKEHSQEYVAHLTSSMLKYPMEDVLCAGYHLSDYKPELVTKILDHMVASKCLVFSESKDYESKASLTEDYYGIKYNKESISPELVKKFESCGTHSDLKLPLPNEFIPTEFDLKKREENRGICPRVLMDTEFSRVWFLQDTEFLLPKGLAKMELYSELPLASPLNANLLHMLMAAVKDSLTEETYSAAMAGLEYDVEETVYGLQVLVHGYDHKLAVLFDKVINKIINFTCSAERFELLKDLYVRTLQNWKDEQPYNHAIFNLWYILSEKCWSHDQLLEHVEGVTLENLRAFIDDFLRSLRFQWLLHGNFTSTEATNLVTSVEEAFAKKGTKPLAASKAQRLRELRLPDGSNYTYRTEHYTHHSSCTSVLFQTGLMSTHENVLMELLDHIANEPCFSQLRTQEQLGYIVMTTVRRSHGTQGFQILIQSDRHPAFVDSRIENFLRNLNEKLQAMPDAEFEQLREGLTISKAEKPKTLIGRAQILWNEIFSQQYNFERQEVELKELAQISKLELIEFFRKFVEAAAPFRRRMSVQVLSMFENGAGQIENEVDQLDLDKLEETSTKIEDLAQFKQKLEFYPVLNLFNQVSNEAKSKL